MLKMDRRVGEGIYIGSGIRISVLEILEDGSVVLGVVAPRSIAVSKDDFPISSHMRRQEEREPTLDVAGMVDHDAAVARAQAVDRAILAGEALEEDFARDRASARCLSFGPGVTCECEKCQISPAENSTELTPESEDSGEVGDADV